MFERTVHNVLQLVTWVVMLCTKNWLRDREEIVFGGTFILWCFHSLILANQAIRIKRDNLAYSLFEKGERTSSIENHFLRVFLNEFFSKWFFRNGFFDILIIY